MLDTVDELDDSRDNFHISLFGRPKQGERVTKDVLHARFAHVGSATVVDAQGRRQVRCDGDFSVCRLSKIKRSPISKAAVHRSEDGFAPGEHICWDPGGKVRTEMVGGYNYIVPAGDCTTKFQKIFLTKRKSEFGDLFMEFVNWVECQSGRRDKQVSMDNELRTNNQVIKFFKGKGIEVAWTAPGRSDENPFGEGSNSRIQQSIRVLLSTACQPASMAGFAAQYAAYVQGRMLEADGTSRLEKLTG